MHRGNPVGKALSTIQTAASDPRHIEQRLSDQHSLSTHMLQHTYQHDRDHHRPGQLVVLHEHLLEQLAGQQHVDSAKRWQDDRSRLHGV